MKSLLFLLAIAFATIVTAQYQDADGDVLLDIPARIMWGQGIGLESVLGYCGEMSVQVTGVYFGMYASQELIRLKATGSGFCELLLGANATKAVQKLLLTYEQFNQADATFLIWAQAHIDAGHPLVVAWMNKGPSTQLRSHHASDWVRDLQHFRHSGIPAHA